MPHLKVKPFDSSDIASSVGKSAMMTLHAKSLSSTDEIIGVEHGGEEFLLQLKPDTKATLLKYDKVSRPLKVNLLKEALATVSEELGLEVLSSNIAISNTKQALSSEYFKKIEDFENINFPKDKVSVEVGFGSGRHLLYQAQKNPDILFIGLEIHTPSAQQVLKQIALQNISNIWVVNYDARLFLEMLPSNICETIFVHFPVPWDKKPHRRVMSDEFIAECMRVLKVDGSLELRTDSPNYFEYNEELLTHFPSYKSTIEKNKDLAISSKYEDRWKKQGKDIWDVTIYAKDVSANIEINKDFSFNIENNILQENLENNLPTKAVVKDGYFVHMEHLYIVNENKFLLHLTMGSFNKPLAKYLLIQNNEITYFQTNPIPTSANQHAHKLINELINKAVV